MPTFTLAELDVLARRRKQAGKRPKVANKSTTEPVEISLDFEAMLILAGDVGKANASSFINILLNHLPSVASRELLMAEVLIDEYVHAQSIQTGLLPFLLSYENVKNSFNPGPFAEIPDVRQFFSDLQLGFASFSLLNEKAQYNLSLVGYLTIRDVLGYGEETIKANLRSYIGCINAYRGTT